jgi:hypothetical protein
MKIKKTSNKEETLTPGGIFGMGILASYRFGRSLSNKRAMNRSISAWVKTVQDRKHIRSRKYIIGNKG